MSQALHHHYLNQHFSNTVADAFADSEGRRLHGATRGWWPLIVASADNRVAPFILSRLAIIQSICKTDVPRCLSIDETPTLRTLVRDIFCIDFVDGDFD